MIENEKDRQALINYRIEQAEEAAQNAKLLIDNEAFNAAVNRIYYALFYMTSALALKHQFKTSKHQQLIGWFNKEFVKDGFIEPIYGKILKKSFENRSASDYGEYVAFVKEEVLLMYDEMNDFINRIKQQLG